MPSGPPFSELTSADGYLPLRDYALVGDGTTAALVGRDGNVAWLCVPRFDSDPLLCSLLDRRRGGAFRVAPHDLVSARQFYEADTGVLTTEMRGPEGVVQVTDALTLRAGASLDEAADAGCGELLRSVTVIEGRVRLVVELTTQGGVTADGGGKEWRLRDRSLRLAGSKLRLAASVELPGLHSTHELRQGDRLHVALRWGETRPTLTDDAAHAALTMTSDAWHRWARCISYDGPYANHVRRSAVVLKQLDHGASGAIVAAPTSSLPEAIGGSRNWDYRYAWVRDAAFSVYALRRIGLGYEANHFLNWVLDAIERGEGAHVLFDLDGKAPPPERVDDDLEGYRRSRPVRWGNAAFDQVQHDAYGEILDCAFQWVSGGGRLSRGLWDRLTPLVDAAASRWRTPDQGIWEVRTAGRPFTYSAAMCQVALDRGARLANASGLPSTSNWARDAAALARTILEEAWDPARQSLTEHLGGSGGLDASLLALPLRRVVDANHPRMVATARAVTEELGAGDGLLYRYLPHVSPDGVAGHDEGAFLLCSFWLVDNLAMQGRLDEAHHLLESLCARAGALGLLPEQIDPASGGFLGNFPQAFSHVGLVSSAVNLQRSETDR